VSAKENQPLPPVDPDIYGYEDLILHVGGPKPLDADPPALGDFQIANAEGQYAKGGAGMPALTGMETAFDPATSEAQIRHAPAGSMGGQHEEETVSIESTDDGLTITPQAIQRDDGGNVTGMAQRDPVTITYATIVAASGRGIPAGGTTGQALAKVNNTDYNVSWQTISSIPTGGAAGQSLVKNTGADGDVKWDWVRAH
jgi:hypothetical protein